MIKQPLFVALALFALSFNVFGQNDYIKASGKVVTKDYQVSDFSGVDISTDFQAYITFSDQTSVTIEVDDNMVNFVEVNVNNGVLSVRENSRSWVKGKQTLNAYISVPSLDYIKGSSDAIIVLKNPLNTDRLKVDLSGDSTLEGEVNANSIDTYLKGDSYLTISGGADHLKGDVSGDSEIRNYDLVIKNIDLKLRGDSVAEVTVQESMKVDLNGDSEMRYKGNPEVMKQYVRGDSEIRKVN